MSVQATPKDDSDDPLLENPDLVPLRAANVAAQRTYAETWFLRAVFAPLALPLAPWLPSIEESIAASGLREAKRGKLLKVLTQEFDGVEPRLDPTVLASPAWKDLVLHGLRLAEDIDEESFLNAAARAICDVAVGGLDIPSARLRLDDLAAGRRHNDRRG